MQVQTKPVTTTPEEYLALDADKIYFEAETINPKQGRIKWRGIVHGDSIEVNYRWSKKGWLSDTVKDYSFNGRLKK